ncbi:MAG: dephospho-CoA kinase [Bdellovibrionota bacterium]
MLWIGLTGGIATGKSTVARLIRERGHAVIDADQLAREVVQIGTEANLEIVRVFGPNAVLASGELDRKRIGEVVFSDRTKLALLEGIIHPRVRALSLEKKRAFENEGRAIAFYDVPLLYEKNMAELFDRVVVVACSEKTQLSRLVSRDGFSLEEAKRRMTAQVPIAVKADQADDVIPNEGSLEELAKEVDAYLARSLARSIPRA